MKRLLKILSCILVIFIAALTIAGCAGTPTPTSTPDDSATPTTSPTDAAPFSIKVIPEELKGFSIAGQRCVFLVTITDEGQKSESTVNIKAVAEGAEIIVENGDILDGQVAEVTVIPDGTSVGKTIEVNFTGQRGEIKDEKKISFDVIEGTDDRQKYALELRGKFIPWLVSNHPELGITADTEWIGTMVSPQWLIVSHYIFYSDEWEMHIEWHIMIAPSDWVRIDLRKRYEEQKPSLAFEISSVTENSIPKAIEVPETIWR